MLLTPRISIENRSEGKNSPRHRLNKTEPTFDYARGFYDEVFSSVSLSSSSLLDLLRAGDAVSGRVPIDDQKQIGSKRPVRAGEILMW